MQAFPAQAQRELAERYAIIIDQRGETVAVAAATYVLSFTRRVTAGRHVGEVTRVSADGSQFWLVNAGTGLLQVFDAGFWRERAAAS